MEGGDIPNPIIANCDVTVKEQRCFVCGKSGHSGRKCPGVHSPLTGFDDQAVMHVEVGGAVPQIIPPGFDDRAVIHIEVGGPPDHPPCFFGGGPDPPP